MLTSRYLTIENSDYLATYRCGWNFYQVERLADGETWRFPADELRSTPAAEIHPPLRKKFHAFLATV